ncbi:uncharacterized protein PRCAT00004557001 [Priceomyces carsonii]|uniref:uncharacterized protein n=1 Tax=Priceomyces carsonii TaxID=28549 RepID=UPI002ED98C61|nr:unnamed protein product [Priceomyces carsonii]
MKLNKVISIGVFFAFASAFVQSEVEQSEDALAKDLMDPKGELTPEDKKIDVNPIDDLDGSSSPLSKPSEPQKVTETNEEGPSNYNSFLMSISMILVSEIGDKTFLIAALMAMRNSRWVVFSSAVASLGVMTILSGIVGHTLPSLISQRLTQFLASILFVIFGVKLCVEGLGMPKGTGVEDELAEVEEEIACANLNTNLEDQETGSAFTPKVSKPWYNTLGEQLTNLASFIFSPIWIQVFVMTFLGEWGDRSQIATIAMAAGSDYWFVIFGAVVGHTICSAAACIGGKLLAKKISMRNVTFGGAIAFFIFAILYFYGAYYYEAVPEQ